MVNRGWPRPLIVLIAVGVIVTPTIMLASQFGDFVQGLIKNVRDNTLQIPAPSEKIATWPVVGAKVHAIWSQAHNDLPGLVQTMQPKLGELATKALGIVAALGGITVLHKVEDSILAPFRMLEAFIFRSIGFVCTPHEHASGGFLPNTQSVVK